MSDAKHSPTPWRWEPRWDSNEGKPDICNSYCGALMDADGNEVCWFGETYYPTCGNEPDDADTALIVRAVNAHEALVAALRVASKWIGDEHDRAIVRDALALATETP